MRSKVCKREGRIPASLKNGSNFLHCSQTLIPRPPCRWKFLEWMLVHLCIMAFQEIYSGVDDCPCLRLPTCTQEASRFRHPHNFALPSLSFEAEITFSTPHSQRQYQANELLIFIDGLEGTAPRTNSRPNLFPQRSAARRGILIKSVIGPVYHAEQESQRAAPWATVRIAWDGFCRSRSIGWQRP